jgi:hypothetical protein
MSLTIRDVRKVQGDCLNSCKGMNSCKGQGWVSLSKSDCTDAKAKAAAAK